MSLPDTLERSFARSIADIVTGLRGEDLRIVADVVELVRHRFNQTAGASSLPAASSSERESAYASARADAGPVGQGAGSFGFPEFIGPVPELRPEPFPVGLIVEVLVGDGRGMLARIAEMITCGAARAYRLDRPIGGRKHFEEHQLAEVRKAT